MKGNTVTIINITASNEPQKPANLAPATPQQTQGTPSKPADKPSEQQK